VAQDIRVITLRIVRGVCGVEYVWRPGPAIGVAFEDESLVQALRVRRRVFGDNVNAIVGVDDGVVVQDVVVVRIVFGVLPVLNRYVCVDVAGVI
jgi:hypothetical protein